MIPSALFCCLSDVPEIRALELSDRFFTFRVTGPDMVPTGPVTLCFRETEENRYREITVCDYVIREEKEEASETEPDPGSEKKIKDTPGSIADFCRTYRFETEEPAYREAARKFTREYLTYIRRKLSGDDAALAEAMTGYPAALEEVTAENFAEQKRRWRKKLPAVFPPLNSEQRFFTVLCQFSLGVLVDHRERWEQYLGQPAQSFFRLYLAENVKRKFGERHNFGDLYLRELWIGNAFCPDLFPDTETLIRILRKAWREDLIPAVVLPWIAEHDLPKTKALLSRLKELLEENGKALELIVNDWGTAELIRKYARLSDALQCRSGSEFSGQNRTDGDASRKKTGFIITPGVLLMKRRKDVRLPWKQELREEQKPREGQKTQADRKNQTGEKALTHTLADDEAFRQLLKDRYGSDRYVLETVGTPQSAEGMRAALLFPWYQMNTAQYCILYSVCRYGNRGHQEEPEHCPHYCEAKCFLYPDFLHMTGRYNSLFGLDTEALKDPELLTGMRRSGADRLIFNFL